MHIKKGDKVIVLSGDDKGKTGAVLRAFPRLNKVLVEEVNVKKVAEKAEKKEGKGSIVERAYPVDVSNVKHAKS